MRVLLMCAVLAIVGCSTGGPRGGGSGGEPMTKATLMCQGGSGAGPCNVVVHKTCGGASCNAGVSHDPVQVTGGANKIHWILAAPHVHWRGAGIVPEPGSPITCSPPTGNTVQCDNPGNPKPAPGWKYTVMIDGAPDLDPFIINN